MVVELVVGIRARGSLQVRCSVISWQFGIARTLPTNSANVIPALEGLSELGTIVVVVDLKGARSVWRVSWPKDAVWELIVKAQLGPKIVGLRGGCWGWRCRAGGRGREMVKTLGLFTYHPASSLFPSITGLATAPVDAHRVVPTLSPLPDRWIFHPKAGVVSARLAQAPGYAVEVRELVGCRIQSEVP